MGLPILDPLAPVLDSRESISAPLDGELAVPFLGTNSELDSATSGLGSAPTSPIAYPLGTRSVPSGAQAPARSSTTTLRHVEDREADGRSLGRHIDRPDLPILGLSIGGSNTGDEDSAVAAEGRPAPYDFAASPRGSSSSSALFARRSAFTGSGAPPAAPRAPFGLPDDVERPGRAAEMLPERVVSIQLQSEGSLGGNSLHPGLTTVATALGAGGDDEDSAIDEFRPERAAEMLPDRVNSVKLQSNGSPGAATPHLGLPPSRTAFDASGPAQEPLDDAPRPGRAAEMLPDRVNHLQAQSEGSLGDVGPHPGPESFSTSYGAIGAAVEPATGHANVDFRPGRAVEILPDRVQHSQAQSDCSLDANMQHPGIQECFSSTPAPASAPDQVLGPSIVVDRPGRAAEMLPERVSIGVALAAATARALGATSGPSDHEDLLSDSEDDSSGQDCASVDSFASQVSRLDDFSPGRAASMLPAGGDLRSEAPLAQGPRTHELPMPFDGNTDPVLTVYAHNTAAFSCALCAHSCRDLAALVVHRRTAHRGTRFVDHFHSGCTCGIGFQSRATATKHAMACKDSSYAAASAARDSSPIISSPARESSRSRWNVPRNEVAQPHTGLLSAEAPATEAVTSSDTSVAVVASTQSAVPTALAGHLYVPPVRCPTLSSRQVRVAGKRRRLNDLDYCLPHPDLDVVMQVDDAQDILIDDAQDVCIDDVEDAQVDDVEAANVDDTADAFAVTAGDDDGFLDSPDFLMDVVDNVDARSGDYVAAVDVVCDVPDTGVEFSAGHDDGSIDRAVSMEDTARSPALFTFGTANMARRGPRRRTVGVAAPVQAVKGVVGCGCFFNGDFDG